MEKRGLSECKKLAQTDYKQRHDNLARIVHWKLCGENRIERANNWYEHEPKGVVETKNIKLLWDFVIQCDHHIVHRKPDIVIIEKSKRVGKIIDIAIPVDNRIEEKENEKIEKGNETNLEPQISACDTCSHWCFRSHNWQISQLDKVYWD